MTPSVSIIIPTRARPDYLRVALSSIAEQAAGASAETLVVDDEGPSPSRRALVEGLGARYQPHARPLGLNVARNTGVEHTCGDLLVFVDDDVEVTPDWLSALIAAAQDHPDVNVFTGPIRVRLEGSPPRSCGREGPPITSLDLGERDTEQVRYAWGANMAVRRSALERVGPFDVSLVNGGDEQEWQDRLRSLGLGTVRYVARAALDHRRSPADARLLALMRAANARGVASRRFDSRRDEAPPIAHELRTLAGCMGHVVRYRCPAGLTMVAHSAGRMRQAIGERADRAASPPPAHEGEDFLSGSSGTVGGSDALRRAVVDRGAAAFQVLSGQRLLLGRAARKAPPRRRVLVVGVERPEHRELTRAIRSELARTRHEIEVEMCPQGDQGKFENLNMLLSRHPVADYDWLLVIDDDVVLPGGFLDRLLFLAERFSLDLAQPAYTLSSHAAWQVTRRRLTSMVRETRFVEIGPVTAFAARTFSELLPFPQLRMGWGLDLHWAALAQEHGWRCGVLDALAIDHTVTPAATTYSRESAVAEARAFLADRPYLSASEAQQTLLTHRRW
jgi:GT2 family glycosyltransferase